MEASLLGGDRGGSNRVYMPEPTEIRCLQCEKILSVFEKGTNAFVPSCEKLFADGNVPVPNCGWFCSQECANKWVSEKNVRFQRDQSGNVSYY